jgi:hypothetical protein
LAVSILAFASGKSRGCFYDNEWRLGALRTLDVLVRGDWDEELIKRRDPSFVIEYFLCIHDQRVAGVSVLAKSRRCFDDNEWKLGRDCRFISFCDLAREPSESC